MIKKRKLLTLVNYQIDQAKLVTLSMVPIFVLQLFIAFIAGLLIKDDAHVGSGSIEIVAIVYAIIVGVAMFGSGFKVAIENGVSRKTYFFSMVLGYLFAVTVFTAAMYLFSLLGRVVNTLSLTQLIYGDMFFVKEFIFYFCVLAFFASISAFIRVLMRRIEKRTRYLLLIISVIVIGALVLADVATSGRVLGAVADFALLAAGLKSAAPNVLIAALSSLVVSILCFGGVYLLLRRAEVKH